MNIRRKVENKAMGGYDVDGYKAEMNFINGM